MSENQIVEWKGSWRDEYLKWICGFANARGGILVVGKNDRGEPDGGVSHPRTRFANLGSDVGPAVKIAQFIARQRGIHPSINLGVQVYQLSGSWLA